MDLGTVRADTVSRQLDRQTFTPDVRIALVEHDLDNHEALFAELSRGMKGLNARLLAFIVTFATSGVLLAADVALRRA